MPPITMSRIILAREITPNAKECKNVEKKEHYLLLNTVYYYKLLLINLVNGTD